MEKYYINNHNMFVKNFWVKNSPNEPKRKKWTSGQPLSMSKEYFYQKNNDQWEIMD